jgi:reactive chlorine resistance protein C
LTVKGNVFHAAILNAEPVVRSVGNVVARYGLAIVIGWIGIFKFFYPYEAHSIQPWWPMVCSWGGSTVCLVSRRSR